MSLDEKFTLSHPLKKGLGDRAVFYIPVYSNVSWDQPFDTFLRFKILFALLHPLDPPAPHYHSPRNVNL